MMARLIRWLLPGALWLVFAVQAQPSSAPLPMVASEAAPLAADVQLEARVKRLAEQLRCLVCQNQSIADSHAGLAIDLKNQVREQLQAGRSDEQVIAFMVERFGDFVLYKPPLRWSTWLLWAGPFVLLLVGTVLLARRLRSAEPPAALDAAARELAQALLDGRAAP